MTSADYAMMFGLGLAGSLHCVQMCGPLVLSIGIPIASEPRTRQAAAHLAYNLGRVTTYASLGAVAGWLGAGMTWAGRLAGIENTAAMVAGGFMVMAGLLMMDLVRAPSLVRIGPASWLSRAAGRLLQSPALRTRFGMGLLLGLLPCGLIYAALLKSVATADGWSGAASMLLFGLGTAAPLVAVGLFSGVVGRWFAGRSSRWAAVSVTAMGMLLIWRGWMPVTLAASCHPH